jgi:hypothetical protein
MCCSSVYHACCCGALSAAAVAAAAAAAVSEMEAAVGNYIWGVRRATRKSPFQVPRAREVSRGLLKVL